ncbi:MAG: glycosyltransferase family 2 protein [Patescibacteria group bacterium]
MYKNKKVSVVISTYNESGSIRGVIDGLFETGLVDEVVVVDNNALGNTKEEVGKTKARLVFETKQGLGHGLKKGFEEVSGDLIAMIDADGTYQSKDIEKLLAYSDEFDVVLGTRTSRSAIWSGAHMPFIVRIANLIWAKAVEFLYNGPLLTDVGCLYKLISRKAFNEIKDLLPIGRGDGIFNLEMVIWFLKKDVKVIEIPVIFKERVGESMYIGRSTLKAAKWGFKMIPVILKYLFKKI